MLRPALFALPALGWIACAGDPDPIEAPFVPRATIAEVAPDPLAGGAIESCPVYQAESCDGGVLRRCEIYDPGKASFVDTPDPLLRRVFLYDRWYDRFESPLGLTGERVFTGAMPGDAPESEWSAPSRFSGWAGLGDAAIWTGVAAVADTFRYAQTRTEADYQRMEAKLRTLVRNFEVTGVPGYLARFHFLLLPDTATVTDQLILRYGDEGTLGKVDIPMPSVDVAGLPDAYRLGVEVGGSRVPARAFWNGDPSIDQYTGPMVAFPLAYNLVRDDGLKAKMAYHLTCYLKRLQRIEIQNLRARPDLLNEIRAFFGGTRLRLDADDPNLEEIDSMVWYVHPGINRDNYQGFDQTCPEHVATQPARVIDARSESFELDVLQLSSEINRSNRRGQTQIDHFYILSLRGGDASHLIHLAAMAYYMTNDEQYRRFLFDELLGNLRAQDVARTMMAFRLPDWCFRFYGDHITYSTHWQLITMLPDGELRDQMIRVMEEEVWQKAMFNHQNAKANVMYASTVPPELASARDRALDELKKQLSVFGGNGGTQDAPRRTHNHDRQSVIDRLPADTTLRCPTEEDRSACETDLSLLGFPLEGDIITRDCDGRPGECRMADGKCADGLASKGLSADRRRYADFMWQRSPFDIGEAHGADGQVQSPGRDLSEPYWMARHYGYVTEGAGQVLAWRDAGSCR
ncbi:MAG: hypothetical protein IT384_10180 [Deltaproteobacteria bacterium]|nr:hypothetical protein [Deltaproteobacteria bacterium]